MDPKVQVHFWVRCSSGSADRTRTVLLPESFVENEEIRKVRPHFADDA
jgi:hypothetical protein